MDRICCLLRANAVPAEAPEDPACSRPRQCTLRSACASTARASHTAIDAERQQRPRAGMRPGGRAPTRGFGRLQGGHVIG